MNKMKHPKDVNNCTGPITNNCTIPISGKIELTLPSVTSATPTPVACDGKIHIVAGGTATPSEYPFYGVVDYDGSNTPSLLNISYGINSCTNTEKYGTIAGAVLQSYDYNPTTQTAHLVFCAPAVNYNSYDLYSIFYPNEDGTPFTSFKIIEGYVGDNDGRKFIEVTPSDASCTYPEGYFGLFS